MHAVVADAWIFYFLSISFIFYRRSLLLVTMSHSAYLPFTSLMIIATSLQLLLSQTSSWMNSECLVLGKKWVGLIVNGSFLIVMHWIVALLVLSSSEFLFSVFVTPFFISVAAANIFQACFVWDLLQCITYLFVVVSQPCPAYAHHIGIWCQFLNEEKFASRPACAVINNIPPFSPFMSSETNMCLSCPGLCFHALWCRSLGWAVFRIDCLFREVVGFDIIYIFRLLLGAASFARSV